MFLVFFCTLLTSSAQVLYKFGSASLSFDLFALLTNYYLIGGLCLYGVGALILIIGLKGGDLSVLYPIISTGFIWVALYSIYIFNEHLTMLKWIGIFSIIAGIVLIGFGNNDADAAGVA